MAQSHYVIRGGVEGRERLRILARVVRPTTRSLLERVGLRADMACLDVGCGGGDATCEIARIVGPRGRAVGVDMDATKIELARAEAAEAGLSAEFRVSDAGTSAGAAEFDVVYARFLLTHLSDPGAVLTQMIGHVRPGGNVVVEDIDFRGHFCHPESVAFRRYVDLYSAVVRRRGGDPDIGPRLPELLREAGCERIEMNVVQPAGMEGDVKLIAPLTMDNIAEAVVTEGLASKEEVDNVVGELYASAEDPSVVVGIPRIVQAWGWRATH